MNRKKGKRQKNKKERYQHDGRYRQLRTTLFLRTILLLITDAVLLLIFSDLYLFGRFANFMVGILNRFIYHDYDRALEAYQLIFRNRLEWFWLMGLFAVFLVSMWIYLRNFTKYFYEIMLAVSYPLWVMFEPVEPELFEDFMKLLSIKRRGNRKGLRGRESDIAERGDSV